MTTANDDNHQGADEERADFEGDADNDKGNDGDGGLVGDLPGAPDPHHGAPVIIWVHDHQL